MRRAQARIVPLPSFQWQERGHWQRQNPSVLDRDRRYYEYRKNTLRQYKCTLAFSAVPVTHRES